MRIDWTEDDLKQAERKLAIHHGAFILAAGHSKNKSVRRRCQRIALWIGVALEEGKAEPENHAFADIDQMAIRFQKGLEPYGLEVIPKHATA